MLLLTHLKKPAFVFAAPLALVGGMAQATTIEITFSNTNSFGFIATPVYSAFHDGSFDAFNAGDTASAGIEQIAEVPIPPFAGQVIDTSGFASGSAFINNGELRPGVVGADQIANNLVLERTAVDPKSTARFLPGAGGPIVDGETVSFTLDVDPAANRFASFFAMVVHSNDTFFGNDDPFAYQIFDANGNFVAQDPISITASSIYDAGTEGNAVFGSTLPGEAILDGLTGEGKISNLLADPSANGGFESLASLFGTAGNFGPGGFTAKEAALINGDTEFFRISISEVPAPIPLPAAGWMLVGGIGGLVALRRRKRS